MSEPERKRTSNEPDTFREVEGFGKAEPWPDGKNGPGYGEEDEDGEDDDEEE